MEQHGNETGTEYVRQRVVGLEVEERQEPHYMSLDFTEYDRGQQKVGGNDMI